ncbi:hypothetical protein PUNSTDRAFT_110331 [Punctularia strigosozonata HHB-11173 SS5]|uniref:uncharacterized protein n=1 Tax=Punctularia strigosozonata (strain HHB-11173) TaxID=741275 RepID=UPI00044185C9|nr:uncharacterized protein PUNSTDRAFT_110331 [Punctularia strigosozonata HHB-11173 SS5]EIN14205.1 hypothetical protein PUNSTDRAFT_110331 [Punctularia strigosozonata HHB-11173 SS5]
MASKIIVEKPLLQTACMLGEGPLYDARTCTLHFVDIEERKVFHLNVETLDLVTEDFGVPVTSLALRKQGPGLACTTALGFALAEGDGRLTYLAKPLPTAYAVHTRFNDGACDVNGRYFAGTVCSKTPEIPGQLYRYDPTDLSCKLIDEGPFTDSNGLGWSPDGKTLYFTDSLVNRIHAYDYDSSTGDISNRRVHIDPLAEGLPENSYPDGLCIDSEGGIWSARWGASRINRFNQDGKIDFEIVFPTALNITACEFGGPNLDKLYVTSAHCGAVGGDASRQALYPDSGHLFVVDLAGQFHGGKWRFHFGG